MATTVQGGAYQDAAGNWHDANGKPLEKDVQASAEKLHAEQSDQKADADRLALQAAVQRDPVARALLEAQRATRPAAKPVKPAKDDGLVE
jgi:GH24 family phage-related lysozyme (muramidase)